MDIASLFGYALFLFILYKIWNFFSYKLRIGNVENKNVLITGCDTGFGHELAKQLDAQGVKVFAGCLTEIGETELRKQCSKNLVTLQLDVSKPSSVRKAYDKVTQHIPDGKGLWGLVNNAGINIKSTVLEALTIEDYRQVLDVNLLGMIDTTVTFLPLIKLAKGRIVNMSSVGGRLTGPLNLPYSISKYGVESFSDGLRRQLRDFGVGVHIIEPGIHNTNLIRKSSSDTESAYAGWNDLPKNIQDEYGEEYFKGIVKTTMKVPEMCGTINDPQNVVNAYKHALFGLLPKARYMVGSDTYIWKVFMTLPEWLSDWLMVTLMKDLPKPKSCRK